MADRKAELERKRAKLIAIREEKERRRQEMEQQRDKPEAGPSASGGGGEPVSFEGASISDLDSYLESLGIPTTTTPANSGNTAMTTQPGVENGGGDPGGGTNSAVTADGTKRSEPMDQETPQKRMERLRVSQVTQTNIPSQEVVSYSKETQTAQSGPDHRDSHAFDYYDEDSSLSLDHHRLSTSTKLPPGILKHGMPEVTEVAPALTPGEKPGDEDGAGASAKPKVPEMSEEEKQAVVMSPSFKKFFERAARIMERALSQHNPDIFVDYSKSGDGEDEREEKSATKITLNRVFYNEKWSKNRCITSLDWSTAYPELLAASYSANEEAPHDPDGVCLIWNTKFNNPNPEYIFHCQSPVMSVCFAKFHPNLVLGGTYSGSIVLWDNRLEKQTPVQRSPLTTSAHTHPVYCLQVVGTQNSHNVISISTDGKMCCWSLDMLAQPQETIDLLHRQGKPTAPSCLAFPRNSTNNFVIGSEEGTVYSACRHGTNKSGIIEAYEGHHAPVTAIHPHQAQGSVDFTHLFLTSSFDWSMKLWSLKEAKPLYSFDVSGDYIYDIAWSPIHPAVFASVDGGGKLDLWNLNLDTELPTASITVENGDGEVQVALNRVSWTASGLHVVAGDDMGRIYVYDVGEQLANPRQDEWQRFSKTLAEIVQSSQTGDALDHLHGVPGTLNRN